MSQNYQDFQDIEMYFHEYNTKTLLNKVFNQLSEEYRTNNHCDYKKLRNQLEGLKLVVERRTFILDKFELINKINVLIGEIDLILLNNKSKHSQGTGGKSIRKKHHKNQSRRRKKHHKNQSRRRERHHKRQTKRYIVKRSR